MSTVLALVAFGFLGLIAVALVVDRLSRTVLALDESSSQRAQIRADIELSDHVNLLDEGLVLAVARLSEAEERVKALEERIELLKLGSRR